MDRRSVACNWINDWFDYGRYGNTTLIHELGHALGLSHPGAITTASGRRRPSSTTRRRIFPGHASNIRSCPTSSRQRDGRPDRIDCPNSGGLFDLSGQTPLLHDISVIQAKYGADPTTRAGDTIYGFNSNAGNAVYDFTQNPDCRILSIYDAGGNDTIDLSGLHRVAGHRSARRARSARSGDDVDLRSDRLPTLHDNYLD